MTSEQKARELIGQVRTICGTSLLGDRLARELATALERAIEAHEADKARHAAELREQAERFSEAARLAVDYVTNKSSPLERFGYGSAEYNAVRNSLSPFILPPVDPLVEAVKSCGYATLDAIEPEFAADLRAALDARGLAIVKKGATNG